MSKVFKKKVLIVFIALVVLLVVLAIYFIFIASDGRILRTNRHVHAAAAQGEHIYFVHSNFESFQAENGEWGRNARIDVKRTTFEGKVSSVFSTLFEVARAAELYFAGFHVTDDGYFRFLIHESNDGRGTSASRIHYITHNEMGQLVFHHILTDFMTVDLNNFATVSHAVFTPAGDVVFSMRTADGANISIVDQTGVIRNELQDRLGNLVQARDGRNLVLLHTALYELDVITGEFGKSIAYIQLDGMSMWVDRFSIVPSWAQFDLYFSDLRTNRIYGYNLSTGVLTLLVDLSPMVENYGRLRMHEMVWGHSFGHGGVFCILPDDRIALFYEERWRTQNGESRWRTNLVLLEPQITN